MTKTYGSVDKAIRPLLPRMVEAFKRGGASRPYEEVAWVLGVSASRVQQIVLNERRKEEEGD